MISKVLAFCFFFSQSLEFLDLGFKNIEWLLFLITREVDYLNVYKGWVSTFLLHTLKTGGFSPTPIEYF